MCYDIEMIMNTRVHKNQIVQFYFYNLLLYKITARAAYDVVVKNEK